MVANLGERPMTVAAQIMTVEKLIARSKGDLVDLRSQKADQEDLGLDAADLRSRVISVEGTLEYLRDILDALQTAEPVSRRFT